MRARYCPAKRGDIYDKNGNILATSNKVYNVILDCKTVNSDEDYVEPTIRALNEVLGLMKKQCVLFWPIQEPARVSIRY